MKRTETSKWKDGRGHVVTVIGVKADYFGCTDWVFHFAGHNPFPFKECRGAYHVLAMWLSTNGYTRVVNADPLRPDTVTIER